MAKLYATLENSKGKTVSISDNNQITATVYDGNMKAYSVIIEWCNVGEIEEPTMGAIVTTREWRNQPEENRKRKVNDTGKDIHQNCVLTCSDCGGCLECGCKCTK